MNTLIRYADDVLHLRRWASDADDRWSTVGALTLIIIACGATYGAIMGSFGGTSADRLPQIVYSACKVPLLLILTFLLSLPGFYVVNMLFGLGRDFRAAVRAPVATQAGISIVLAALAPYTAFWYLSADITNAYRYAVLLNAFMFAIASFSGQWLFRRYYQPLIRKNAKHRWLMWAWIGNYALVGIQLGWTLRPFIGSAALLPTFLRAEKMTNAYVVLARLIWSLVSGT